MGIFINKGNAGFAKYTNGEYVDKTAMIAFINSTLNTSNQLTCVTRPRRFGKSMAANMLCAYYDKSCDSSALFQQYKIAQEPSYSEHLNKYPVIYVDMTTFTTSLEGKDEIIDILKSQILADVKAAYPHVSCKENADLMETLLTISLSTGDKFIFIIDEWDALCRELADKPHLMDRYINLLRRMFKTSDTATVFAGVYMTGILPIKKYGTQSALNDFREYSMTTPGAMGGFLGFNDQDVQMLAEKYGMDFAELKRWYDGYEMDSFDWKVNIPEIKKTAIYNPNSVMTAIRSRICNNYWAQTEAFEALQRYIDCDFDRVNESLEKLINGDSIDLRVLRFGNDIHSVTDNHELFTLLIHFGYLTYNQNTRKAKLPNQEIREEFIEALRGSKSHKELAALVQRSDKLLESLLMKDAASVAEGVEYIHNHRVAPNFYNNEQALRSVIRMAFLGAIDHYIEIQELATGKGYADMVYIPRRNSNRPVLVIELKWDEEETTAIDQIRNRDYPENLKGLSNEILLVGISYNKKSKKHSCQIHEHQL